MRKIIYLFMLTICFSGCGIYSFTGANVDPRIKTIAIQQFDNTASMVVPNLVQTFSEALRDKFLTQTSLSLVKNNGDITISGRITEYAVTPITLQGNQTAAQNRLTIKVTVQLENTLDPEQNWEQTFTNFADFPGTQNLGTVEQNLITQINDKITQDIFNRAFANW
ncbi:MAG: hypothetical protein EBS07_05775 [Sphingobacteriia bacterium]|nr:hypothetical protein [Sphingobacteriia bacterium]